MSVKLRYDIQIPRESRFHGFDRNEMKAASKISKSMARLNSDVVRESLAHMHVSVHAPTQQK